MSSMPARSAAQLGIVLDTSSLITEDGAPVDNIYSEKQMRLLTEPLYNTWGALPPMSWAGRAASSPSPTWVCSRRCATRPSSPTCS